MLDAGFWVKAMVITVALGYWLIAFGPSPFLGRRKASGEWVAESWLEWEICRGSTLYRQRFKTKLAARIHAKLFAWILDQRLPFSYWDIDWGGRPKRYPYEFEIRYGVRRVSKNCPADGTPIWLPYMPGRQGYSGEHRMSHPFYWNPENGESRR